MNFSFQLSAAMLFLGMALGGCSLKQASPAKQTFLLEAVRSGDARSGGSGAVLRVREVHVAPAFEGRGFVYRTSEFGYKSDFYHEFLTAPRNLIAGQLQSWLGASRLFRGVVPLGAAGEATHVISANVSALYGDFRDASAPKAVMSIEFTVSRDGAPEILLHKAYRQEAPISARDAESLAKGWSQALAGILGALEADMATAQLK